MPMREEFMSKLSYPTPSASTGVLMPDEHGLVGKRFVQIRGIGRIPVFDAEGIADCNFSVNIILKWVIFSGNCQGQII
jgi:hypothetical protein